MDLLRELHAVFSVSAFAFGAAIGSFLNVVIWRVPRGESIVSPPSHCPKCNAPIKWYQNIPVVSWLCLRGRCANCKAPISARYIFVEVLCGCLFLFAFWNYALLAPVMWIWISLMVVGSFIDYDLQLLPDFVTVGGMVLGLVLGGVFSLVEGSWQPLVFSSIGLCTGFGLLWLIRFFGTKAFKREAMGMGDVFLMGAVGAIFGPLAVIVTLVLGAMLGSVVGLAMIACHKARIGRFVAIPFGPYLCIGCLVWMFWGPELVNAYVKLIMP